jgi:hypothetical protein
VRWRGGGEPCAAEVFERGRVTAAKEEETTVEAVAEEPGIESGGEETGGDLEF